MRAEALVGHAAELLRRMSGSAQPPDAVARDFFRQRSYLGSKERRFVAEISFAVLRCWGTLSWCIRVVGLPDAGIAPEVAAVLAMGGLGERLGNPHLTPAFAAAQGREGALSELWQEAAERLGWGGQAQRWYAELRKSFCQLERDVSQLVSRGVQQWREAEWERFAAACSMPAWILQRWIDNPWHCLSPAQALQVCRALLAPAYPCLRVNTVRSRREAVLAYFAESGIAAAPTPFSPVGIRLWERVALHELRPYREGWVEVQEEGSQLIGYAVAPQAGWRLWDACAGAGGKTLHLAALQGGKGEIWATDVELQRLRALRQRLRRAGVERSVHVVHLRGGRIPKGFPERFHALLVDAPCSGLGTVRRTPTLKWRLSPEALQRHQRRQLELLELYALRVVPGGVMVYATCSLMPEENFAVVARFLERHPQWEEEPLQPVFEQAGTRLPGLTASAAQFLLLPSLHGTDGFFLARLRRRR